MNDQKDEKIFNALIQAVEETFGGMAFIDLIPANDSDELDVSQLIFIEFDKPLRGAILLQMPLEVKKAIVENIHAKEWDDLTVNEIDDCLLELSNVLAGGFLQNYSGRTVRVNLSFPTVIFDLAEIFDISEKMKDYYFSAEGLPVKISLYLEQE